MKARELLRMTEAELCEYFKSNKNQKHHLYLYNIECPEIYINPPSENYAKNKAKVIKKTGLVIIFTATYQRTIGYIGNNTIVNISPNNGKMRLNRIVIQCPDRNMILYFDEKEDLSGVVITDN